MTISTFVLIAAIACLILAAYSDFRSFRIPNIYPGLLLVLFLLFQALTGFSSVDWSHLLHFVLALGFGMLLFARNWLGGGDAKLYAAAALWFPFKDAPLLLAAITLSGLLVVIAYWIARKARRSPEAKAAAKDRRIPYGLAISAGAIIAGLMRSYAL
jgi:prepilin peptidase CpaA